MSMINNASRLTIRWSRLLFQYADGRKSVIFETDR